MTGTTAFAVAPEGTPVTAAVADAARDLAGTAWLPAYIYDLGHLDAHVAGIRAALDATGAPLEVLHAAKANPDPGLLATVARHVHGLEVASGGELAHVRTHLPGVPLAFGGPGKTDAELAAALTSDVDRFHVESLSELRRLDTAARAAGRIARVLLRVNVPAAPGPGGAALTMGGAPSPFGMDPAEADAAVAELPGLPGVEFRGVHAHLASGFDADGGAGLAGTVLAWAAGFAARHRVPLPEVNVGGGMSVDYRRPDRVFDWGSYTRCLAALAAARTPGAVVRIEPGRAISAYSGWYATRVLDLKRSHGAWFAVCAGGTHHLRTPAAKGHSQPLAVLPEDGWANPWPRPTLTDTDVTLVGQLCTPKDVLARDVRLPRLAVGDLVLFGLAGAYAYNISHRDFLMHPQPAVRHVGASRDRSHHLGSQRVPALGAGTGARAGGPPATGRRICPQDHLADSALPHGPA